MGLRKWSMRFWRSDSRRKVSWIEKYIGRKDRVIDIGSGPCYVTSILRDGGYDVTPVDVDNLSAVHGLDPVEFNGKELPFSDNEFDTALLLTVLHHVRDPHDLLRETMRISRRIIIIEDVHSGHFQGLMVKFLDSLINLHFIGHPHNNHSDVEWRDMFNDLGLEFHSCNHNRILFFLTQSVYVLSRT